MSHDFAFWQSDDPLEDDEAAKIYATLLQHGEIGNVRPTEKIAAMVQEINCHWPAPARGHEDEAPWSAPFEISESHLVICISPSRLWNVWPVLGKIAEKHELVMYDPQQSHVFLPRRLSRKRTNARAKKKRRPDK